MSEMFNYCLINETFVYDFSQNLSALVNFFSIH